MQSEKPLADLYWQYKAGNLTKKDFEGMIFQYLLLNYERFRLFRGNRDRWNEFLSWLYPRISRAIDMYRDLGSSFDAYISGLIHSAAREYRCRETDHYMTEYVCWRARAEEMILHENEPEYEEEQKEVCIPGDVNPRQILFLLLKSYFFVSDEYVERVAQNIGIDFEMVKKMIDELRERRSVKEAQILDLRERLYCQHYRCLAYEKRLNAAQAGTDYYEKMKNRFERAKRRFLAMKKRLGGMRTAASNRMIAEVMGIPRGTVDSGLFAIKHRLASQLS
ncbi:MAG: hypothetical protein LBH42_02130 [Treponema sp.]|jgi:hypothetical protein|nr:hypothetical protein [Treponema sp.]